MAPEWASPLEQLQWELLQTQEIVAVSEQWVPSLRQQLDRAASSKDALPTVCSFFALWSLHLLQAIVTLSRSALYSSSLLLLRSLIEVHLELSFILHQDCGRRAAEYLNSSKENRTPYRGQPGFEPFGSLGARAGRCGLGELYRKTYLSLSSYSHLRIKGILASTPGSEKNLAEARACLVVGQAMLIKVVRQISKAFRYPLPPQLGYRYSEGLRRYRVLIRKQEEVLAQRKQQGTPAAPGG